MTESRIIIGDGRDKSSVDWRSTLGSSPLRRMSLADALRDDQPSKRARIQNAVDDEVEQEHESTKDVELNIQQLQKRAKTMTRKWTLRTTGKIVEDTILQMLLSDPERIPNTLAAYFILDVKDAVWAEWFSHIELDEIFEAISPVVLRVEDLDEDEKRVKEILQKLLDSGNTRLNLALLQDKSDTFKSDFRDFVHRGLLVWMETSLANFTWLCGRPKTSRSPPEPYYGYNI